MQKILFYLFLATVFVSCTSGPSTVKIKPAAEKELNISFNNTTRFTVDVLKGNPDSTDAVLHIEPNHSKSIIQKLHVSDDISLFFYSKFYVPVGNTLIPVTNYKDMRIETKNGLNQTVNIEIQGVSSRNSPYYVVLKNNADKEISIYNSSAKELYVTVNQTKTINPKGLGVYSSKDRELFSLHDKISMLIACNGKEFDFPITHLQAGFVYTYSFDGKRVIKEDERPLLKVNEPLWEKADNRNTVVSKIIADSESDTFYAAGKEKKLDAYGNEYYAAYLSCITASGIEKWTKHFEERNCDTALFDAAVLDNGLAAAGQHTGDVHSGLLLLYSKNGTLLQSKKIDKSSVIQRIIKLDGGNYLVTGFDSNGKPFFATASFKNNSIQYKPLQIILPLNINEAISGIVPSYNPASKNLFLFCNLFNTETEEVLPSVLYTVTESGGIEKVSLQNKIKSVAAVSLDKNGIVYIGGETSVKENSAALVLHFDYANKTQSAFYTGDAPYSYISSLTVNEKTKELIIGGTERAADSFGNKGTPFLKSLDTVSGKELWTRAYTGKNYELLSSFTDCTDYGFVAVFNAVDENGEYAAPVCIKRTNAAGKTE